MAREIQIPAEFVIQFNNIKMRNVQSFIELMAKNKFIEAVQTVHAAVVSWPHSSDPQVLESYEELTFAQWRELAQEINKALAAVMSEGN